MNNSKYSVSCAGVIEFEGVPSYSTEASRSSKVEKPVLSQGDCPIPKHYKCWQGGLYHICFCLFVCLFGLETV